MHGFAPHVVVDPANLEIVTVRAPSGASGAMTTNAAARDAEKLGGLPPVMPLPSIETDAPIRFSPWALRETIVPGAAPAGYIEVIAGGDVLSTARLGPKEFGSPPFETLTSKDCGLARKAAGTTA
ncbi:MAG TPA: hypothetical protein VGK48_27140 [Terriglobia bacterium]